MSRHAAATCSTYLDRNEQKLLAFCNAPSLAVQSLSYLLAFRLRAVALHSYIPAFQSQGAGIASVLWVRQPGVRFLCRQETFLVSGAHTASCSRSVVTLSPRVKRWEREADQSHTSSAEVECSLIKRVY